MQCLIKKKKKKILLAVLATRVHQTYGRQLEPSMNIASPFAHEKILSIPV